MKVQRILVGTDFSESAGRAVAQGMRLARHTGATLVLAHAHPMSETQLDAAERSLGRAEGFRKILRQSLEVAHRRLGAELERWSGQGVELRQVLVDVPPEKGLSAAAAELGADLVVVGSQGRTGVKRLLLGSVAEKVIRHVPAPVFVARGEVGAGGFQKILVPVDFSESSGPSVSAAEALAAPGAAIDLLYCHQLPYGAYGHLEEGSALIAPLDDELRADAEARGRALAEAHRQQDKTVAFHLVTATPAQGILGRLDEEPYDLVVVGSHGRSGLKRYLLGSVAEITARHAPCPVLVIRPRGEREA